jgi:hypothetical protein
LKKLNWLPTLLLHEIIPPIQLPALHLVWILSHIVRYMLALDQVLEDFGQVSPILGHRQAVKDGAQVKAKIM